MIRIYVFGTYWMQLVWQQFVQAPSAVAPVVLGSVISIIPRAKYYEIAKGEYRFSVWLEIPEPHKSDVDSVMYYFNHYTFKPKERMCRGPSTGFEYSYDGWGYLPNLQITVWLQEREIITDFAMCDALEYVVR